MPCGSETVEGVRHPSVVGKAMKAQKLSRRRLAERMGASRGETGFLEFRVTEFPKD